MADGIETWATRKSCGKDKPWGRAVRFFGVPHDGGSVYVVDDAGNGYGAYFTVDNFRKAYAAGEAKPLCRVALAVRVVG